MTKVDREVIKKLIAEAREGLSEVKELTSMKLDDFVKSRRARFSLRYSIILLTESLADLAVAILEEDFNLAPESYREAFLKLAEKGVVSAEVAKSMAKLVGLRNVIVHRYWTIDDMRIYDSAKGGVIKAVEDFIEEVEKYVEVKDPRGS